MPDNYPDLSTIYDQLGPMAGAYATGQRQQMGLQSQGLDQANLASIIQGRQLENQYNDQSMGTRLGQGQASLTQTIAGTQGQQLKNQLGAATMDSTIGATNAANKANMSNEQIKSLQIAGQYLGQFGQELGQVPPEKRTQVMAGMLKANPSLQDSPGFMSIMDMDSAQQPGALQKLSQKIVANNPSNQSEMMKIQAQGDKQLQAINATGAQARMTQQQAIDAGKFQKASAAGKTITDQINKETDTVKLFGLLNRATVMAQQEGDIESAQKYQQQAAALEPTVRNKLASAGQMNTTLGATGIENNTRASAVPSMLPQLGPNGPMAAQAQQQLPTMADLQKMYSNRSPEELRKAFKQKYGVDPK